MPRQTPDPQTINTSHAEVAEVVAGGQVYQLRSVDLHQRIYFTLMRSSPHTVLLADELHKEAMVSTAMSLSHPQREAVKEWLSGISIKPLAVGGEHLPDADIVVGQRLFIRVPGTNLSRDLGVVSRVGVLKFYQD